MNFQFAHLGRMKDPLTNQITIRPVRNHAEKKMVYRLTHDCYVEKGYAQPQATGELVHYPEIDRSSLTTVFVAIQNGEVIGSVSLTMDGKPGLSVEHDFKDECAEMRQQGRHLAAVWRLVTRHSSNPSRNVIMGLINETVKRAIQQGATTGLFTVNPRHERIYQKLLGMRAVARKEETVGLKNAPAVFLRCDFEELAEKWRSLGAPQMQLQVA